MTRVELRAESTGVGARRPHRRYAPAMGPLRYSINVTLDGCWDHRAIPADQELRRHAVENLDRADALLLELGSGAVAMRYEPKGHQWARWPESPASGRNLGGPWADSSLEQAAGISPVAAVLMTGEAHHNRHGLGS